MQQVCSVLEKLAALLALLAAVAKALCPRNSGQAQ